MSTATLSAPPNQLEADLEDAVKALHCYERVRLQRSLYAFVQWAFPILEPDTEFKGNWHIEELCRVLERMTLPKTHADRCFKAIVNIPPGTMKSMVCSVFFPAWVWARWPSRKFICASYSSLLSNRDNLKMRDLVTSPEYQALFPVTLHEDQKTKTRFNTDKGGYRLATSVEGGGTGEHPDFIVIDDPASAMDAQSETSRQAVISWYKGTIATRGKGKGVCTLVIAQRLHQEDLPGYLLEQGGWEHVCFPMRYEKARPKTDAEPAYTPDPRDHRTQQGELLFPVLFPEAVVLDLEKTLGPYEAAGQLQQKPVPEGGGLFARGWWKFTNTLPAIRRTCRGWDTAGTEGDGDYTAGVKISEGFEKKTSPGSSATTTASTGLFYVENVERGQLGPDEVDKLMLATATTDGKACAQREEREGGASGKGTIAARSKLLKAFDYEEVSLGNNKVIRSKAFRGQVRAGNVYILKTGDPARDAWIEPFIAELAVFPTGKHDDQVDASSCAYNSLLELPEPRPDFTAWFK
jgi:predicted phage terminase large subunit-like protein